MRPKGSLQCPQKQSIKSINILFSFFCPPLPVPTSRLSSGHPTSLIPLVYNKLQVLECQLYWSGLILHWNHPFFLFKEQVLSYPHIKEVWLLSWRNDFILQACLYTNNLLRGTTFQVLSSSSYALSPMMLPTVGNISGTPGVSELSVPSSHFLDVFNILRSSSL
jgi:hypothetical protein